MRSETQITEVLLTVNGQSQLIVRPKIATAEVQTERQDLVLCGEAPVTYRVARLVVNVEDETGADLCHVDARELIDQMATELLTGDKHKQIMARHWEAIIAVASRHRPKVVRAAESNTTAQLEDQVRRSNAQRHELMQANRKLAEHNDTLQRRIRRHYDLFHEIEKAALPEGSPALQLGELPAVVRGVVKKRDLLQKRLDAVKQATPKPIDVYEKFVDDLKILGMMVGDRQIAEAYRKPTQLYNPLFAGPYGPSEDCIWRARFRSLLKEIERRANMFREDQAPPSTAGRLRAKHKFQSLAGLLQWVRRNELRGWGES